MIRALEILEARGDASDFSEPEAKAIVLGKHGGDRKSEKARSDQPYGKVDQYGNSSSYLEAKIR